VNRTQNKLTRSAGNKINETYALLETEILRN